MDHGRTGTISFALMYLFLIRDSVVPEMVRRVQAHMDNRCWISIHHEAAQ